MDDIWTEDENGTRTFTHKGWKVTSYPTDKGCPYISGPDGEDVSYEEDIEEIYITHDTRCEGTTSVFVPWVICQIAATYRRTRKE